MKYQITFKDQDAIVRTHSRTIDLSDLFDLEPELRKSNLFEFGECVTIEWDSGTGLVRVVPYDEP